MFDVIIWPGVAAAYIAVIDDGSDTVPSAPGHDPADLAESGRGLQLVDLLATQWGHHGHKAIDAGNGNTKRTLVWFRLDWPPATLPTPHDDEPPQARPSAVSRAHGAARSSQDRQR
jgi:hypothetical protein